MAQTTAGALKIAAKKAGLSFDEYSACLAAGQRRCTKCKTWKAVSEFGRDRTRYDGVDRSCFACRRVTERKSTKGRVSTFKGCQHTTQAKRKMSEAKRGLKLRLGIPHTPETRAKISRITRERTPKAEAHYAFSHGRAQRNQDARRVIQYTDWRRAVFERDHYTCKMCGDARGGNLHAHHIRDFANHEELRYDITNGITVCEDCHESIHRGQPRIRKSRNA